MNHTRRVVFTLLACFVAASAGAQTGTAPGTVAEKEVRVFGQKIHYLESGTTGPVVILLHGLGASSSHWRFTMPALSGFHVYAPDQLGFGKSDKPEINYRIATLVDFLNEFYEQTGIQKATLVGNSMGGWVAAAFAVAHPEKVDRLVLVGAAGYSQERWKGPAVSRDELLQLNPATLDQTRKLLLVLFANKQLVTDQTVKAAYVQKLAMGDGDVINAFIESIMRHEDYLDGRLGAIRAPTLLVWGRDDALVPMAVAQAFLADIPGATLTVLDKCGHVPQLECVVPLTGALVPFMSSPARK